MLFDICSNLKIFYNYHIPKQFESNALLYFVDNHTNIELIKQIFITKIEEYQLNVFIVCSSIFFGNFSIQPKQFFLHVLILANYLSKKHFLN